MPEVPIDYAGLLNPAQYEAVTGIDGPLLVIAGAGSGKTRTLVYRVAYLVEHDIPPEAILLLTFTRKSAMEMLRRASELLDWRCQRVAGGTFHSTGSQILRQYGDCVGYPNGFTIMDRSDSEDALGLLVDRLGLKGSGRRFPKKSTVNSIFSKMVNCSLDLNQVLVDEFPQFLEFGEDLQGLYLAYEQYKLEQRLMDYDDLLRHWWRLLEEQPAVRKHLSQSYRYIMVDEYQDTNLLQAEIIRLLAAEHSNVMVVGDDSQSIYSFRGARFRNIMDFPKLFPRTRVLKLEQNYRSTQAILDFTNELISQAHEQYTKCLFSRRESTLLPVLASVGGEKDQSLFVVRALHAFQIAGIGLEDMAVLFRASFHSYDLEVELARAGIPFAKYGGLRFAESAHLKDVVAHLRVLHNPLDAVSWHRLLLLVEGIGPRTAQRLINWIMQHAASATGVRDYLPEQKKTADKARLEPLAALMEELTFPERSLGEMIQAVRSYYEPIAMRKYDDYPKRFRDLDFLEEWAEQYPSLLTLLTDLTLEPPDFYVHKTDLRESGRLTLSTIHSAKGLEWRVVFIIAAAEGRFPSPYASYRTEDLEEELRLFYVASTRAKDHLLISYPMRFGGYQEQDYGGRPSPFLQSISRNALKRVRGENFHLNLHEDAVKRPERRKKTAAGKEDAGILQPRRADYAPGQRVDHVEYGRGVVLKVEDHHVVVVFEKHGKKILTHSE
jgi:DNA helicase II / ATP-dependent DNA helicase PcrA